MGLPRVVTVFGSGVVTEDDPEYQKAVTLGRMLAEAGLTICNGGYGGIMEASARGAKEAGGKTIGVTTAQFDGPANCWIGREIKMERWSDRVLKLIDLGDAYVVLDGGTGTLVELFVVWEMANKKLLSRPIIVLGRRVEALIREIQSWPKVTSHPDMTFVKTTEDVVKRLVSYAKS